MNPYYEYLKERNAALLKEAEQLRAQNRTDESNLKKVAANIYDVCGTVIKVYMNRPGGGVEACRAQLERFKREWGAAKEKAEEHNDTEKAVIEQVKLEALADATARFEEALR